jgi:hypothetical protein
MFLRSLVVFSVLALSVAGAKSFEIMLSQAAKAGTAELQPGKYTVAVEGSKVRFRNADTGKTVETDATVATSDKKYRNTEVNMTSANGRSTVSEIDLGGTNTKVEFSKSTTAAGGGQ